MRTIIELQLPFPPSINGYWRNVKGRTLLSKKGRDYRKEVQGEILVQKAAHALASRLQLDVVFHAPDKRRFDIDNFAKSLLDGMEHSGVFLNDGQIDDLRLRRGEPVPGGKAVVKIRRLNGGAE